MGNADRGHRSEKQPKEATVTTTSEHQHRRVSGVRKQNEGRVSAL